MNIHMHFIFLFSPKDFNSDDNLRKKNYKLIVYSPNNLLK